MFSVVRCWCRVGKFSGGEFFFSLISLLSRCW